MFLEKDIIIMIYKYKQHKYKQSSKQLYTIYSYIRINNARNSHGLV